MNGAPDPRTDPYDDTWVRELAAETDSVVAGDPADPYDDAWIRDLVGEFEIPADMSRDEWTDWFTSLVPFHVQEHRDDIIISGLKAGHTLQEMGDHYQLSRERIRQIANAHGIQIKELRKIQREQAERHYRRIARRVFGTSLTFPELEIWEIAEMWETDEETVRRALEHRLAVHDLHAKSDPRGISEEELLAALVEWAAQAEKVTGTAYDAWAREHGLPGRQTVQNRLGGWNTALSLAGLHEHVQDRGGPRPHVPDATLWASIYGFFREELDSYTAQAYDDYAREHDLASLATLRNRLGTWNEMKQRVRELLRYSAHRDGSWPWADDVLDIVPGEEPRRVSSEEECIASLQRVAARVRGVLTVQGYEDARGPGDSAAVVIQNRCRSWVRAMVKAGLEDRLSAKGRGRLQRGEVTID
ncbi:MAG TPA: hypothetical protein GXZ30_15530 [Propionibacterium sp.]|jgi:hypothetical protein|nr:hypothetical protein [Propionibacterium sp.]